MIRKFQPDDMFSVIKIAHASLPERYNPTVFNHFYETFSDGFLVAEQYHKIIGFIAGLKTVDGIAKILMLAISQKYRKQGIGSALLTKFLKEILLKNIKQVELEVRTNNTTATNFYKKHGFNITDTITGFYQNGEDAYIMRKRI